MNPQQRLQLRQLIDQWYQLILDGKPGAAIAARKLAALANARPSGYSAIALQALVDAGFGPSDES